MKRIIVPVDFSKFSEYALKAAALLAKKVDGEITIVHMLELPMGYSTHDEYYGQSLVFMVKFAEKKIQELLSRDYLKDLNINAIIRHLRVFEEVSNVAEEKNADIIIMGSHGTTDVEDYVLGSNTEKVVRSSEIPVLVIKDHVENIEFDNAVFVSDFKTEAVAAYKKAMALFKILDIKPTLLFINKPDGGFISTNEMNYRFENFLLKADGNLKNMDLFVNYDDYSVEKGVYYYCKENKTNLICVPTHGRTSLSKFFNKSISLDIANKSILPVLTVKI